MTSVARKAMNPRSAPRKPAATAETDSPESAAERAGLTPVMPTALEMTGRDAFPPSAADLDLDDETLSRIVGHTHHALDQILHDIDGKLDEIERLQGRRA